MATRVRFTLPERDIGNTGIKFFRFLDGRKYGELTIKQNVIEWTPSGNQKNFVITWDALADCAQKKGKLKKPKTRLSRSRKKRTGT